MARVAADVRRERLVEAAIRVMVRDGVAKTTTRSIVAEADMPLGAFHYCFRSKQELLENVIEAITGHTLNLALVEMRGEESFEEKLQAALRAYWQHVIANPDEHQVTYELTQYALRQPGLATVARRQYETYLEANTRVLTVLAESTGVTWDQPIPMLARYLTANIDGLTLLFLNEGDAEAAGAALDFAAAHVASMARSA
ncbi:TetR family transcriptional regulator C-terminal domain-containing protein [Nocardioides sp. NPDC023903]|uniref:TetR/AcrR family transcriptional regulator n=1 Tax=Nocardioides sp. NPDC023903 TaxID=3157195 RepID=UPI0033FCBEFC